MKRRITTIPALAICAILLASPAATQTLTPQAREIAYIQDDAKRLTIAVLYPFDQTTNLGFAASCNKADGQLLVAFSFGAFPRNKYVQPAVALPDGSIERFGEPVTTAAGPNAGFHDPILQDPDDAHRALHAVFTFGALVSNGHNSIWNRVPADENRAALDRILACMNHPGK